MSARPRTASRQPRPPAPERPGVRLNKFLAAAGISSRRKADELIRDGAVKVNGRIVESLGVKIDPARDEVFVNGKQAVILDEPIYILFNKPNDCITTASDERGRTTVFHYLKIKRRIFPVGRLDRKTTGVLLLTNDGEFAQRLMHPRMEVKKSYQVTLDKPLLPQDALRLAAGTQLADGMTEPAEIYSVPGGKGKVVGLVIHEGKNRQIHRMLESLGYAVEKLDRVGYGGISCEGLKRGEWRYLTKGELKRLAAAAGSDEAA